MVIKDEQEEAFVAALRHALPEAAARTDQIMRERGHDLEDKLYYLWVEALADVTNEAIRKRDHCGVRQQTSFMASQFDSGTEAVRHCVEVAYVENLLWNVEDSDDNAWAWSLFPDTVQRLFVAMGGEPRF